MQAVLRGVVIPAWVPVKRHNIAGSRRAAAAASGSWLSSPAARPARAPAPPTPARESNPRRDRRDAGAVLTWAAPSGGGGFGGRIRRCLGSGTRCPGVGRTAAERAAGHSTTAAVRWDSGSPRASTRAASCWTWSWLSSL